MMKSDREAKGEGVRVGKTILEENANGNIEKKVCI